MRPTPKFQFFASMPRTVGYSHEIDSGSNLFGHIYEMRDNRKQKKRMPFCVLRKLGRYGVVLAYSALPSNFDRTF